MKTLITSAHIEPDTRFRATSFAKRSNPFVSLRIEGACVEIALLASPGTSEALRGLAAAALDAARALDALEVDAPEVTGRG